MEKSQFKLVQEVFKRLSGKGVLKDMILVGSWCVPFYKEYFQGKEELSPIRTRDIDFLVPFPAKIKSKIDLPNLLNDLGFVVDFIGSKGHIRLIHPELIIEFLP